MVNEKSACYSQRCSTEVGDVSKAVSGKRGEIKLFDEHTDDPHRLGSLMLVRGAIQTRSDRD